MTAYLRIRLRLASADFLTLSEPMREVCAAAADALHDMTWKPIETATRDNNPRLVWVPKHRCTLCVTWSAGDGDESREGWMIFGGGWYEYLQSATHWMPSPDPPTKGTT